jgi:hypothetical protein
LTLAGCTYSADFNGARFACDSLTPCPRRHRLHQGLFASPPPATERRRGLPDAAGSPDAGNGDDRLRWIFSRPRGSAASSSAAPPTRSRAKMYFRWPRRPVRRSFVVDQAGARTVTGCERASDLGVDGGAPDLQRPLDSPARHCLRGSASPRTGRRQGHAPPLGANGGDGQRGHLRAPLRRPDPYRSESATHERRGTRPDTDGDHSAAPGRSTPTPITWSTLDTAAPTRYVVSGVHHRHYHPLASGGRWLSPSARTISPARPPALAGVAVENAGSQKPTSNRDGQRRLGGPDTRLGCHRTPSSAN